VVLCSRGRRLKYFAFVLEGSADDAQHAGHDHGTTQSEQNPSADQHRGSLREGRQQGGETEYDQPRKQNTPVTDPVGQGTRRPAISSW